MQTPAAPNHSFTPLCSCSNLATSILPHPFLPLKATSQGSVARFSGLLSAPSLPAEAKPSLNTC